MSEIERQKNGRFAKGQSGNRKGRKPKRRLDPKLPAARRDVIMRVADRMIDVKVDASGNTERMSLYEANVQQLAIAGAQGNRVAAQRFIELAVETSERDMLMRLQTRMMIDRMNDVEDQLYQLQRKTGQRTGVHVLDWSEYQKQQGRTLDEWSVEEVLKNRTPPTDERDT